MKKLFYTFCFVILIKGVCLAQIYKDDKGNMVILNKDSVMFILRNERGIPFNNVGYGMLKKCGKKMKLEPVNISSLLYNVKFEMNSNDSIFLKFTTNELVPIYAATVLIKHGRSKDYFLTNSEGVISLSCDKFCNKDLDILMILLSQNYSSKYNFSYSGTLTVSEIFNRKYNIVLKDAYIERFKRSKDHVELEFSNVLYKLVKITNSVNNVLSVNYLDE